MCLDIIVGGVQEADCHPARKHVPRPRAKILVRYLVLVVFHAIASMISNRYQNRSVVPTHGDYLTGMGNWVFVTKGPNFSSGATLTQRKFATTR
jgi:hypothetical protein